MNILPAKLARSASILLAVSLAAGSASAQNLILNPGFEDNPPPNNGNNIGFPITPWILGTGDRSNVVKVDGPGGFNYVNSRGRPFGPESDATAPGAGIDQHYLDIASGANDFYQSFTVPTCTNTSPTPTAQYTLSGAFSTRDNLAGSGSVRIEEGTGITGNVVPGSVVGVSLAAGTTATDPLWTVAGTTVSLEVGETFSYVVAMDNNVNFDNAVLTLDAVSCPEITINKSTNSAPTQSGDTLDYEFEVTNTSLTDIDISDIVVTDAKCAAAPVLQSATIAADTTLEFGETQVYSCTSIPVTQAEVTAGVVSNTVDVTGVPDAGELAPASDTLDTPIVPQPPVAGNDEASDLPVSTPAVIALLGNDNDPDGTLDATSVVFTGTATPTGATVSDGGKTLTVPNEGVWTVNDSGVATFTPADGFIGDPTPALYTVNDNDGNTSNAATITLDFNPAVIDAVNDDFTDTPVDGFTGGTVGSVLDDDTLNGEDIDPALTSLAITEDGGLTGVTVGDDGTLTIPAGTPAGTYNVTYEICEDLNPGNCDTAIATVLVEAPEITAVDDDLTDTPVNGASGGSAGSIFAGDDDDTLGDTALTAADIASGVISVTQDTTATPINGGPVPSLDAATGDVIVPAGTPAGEYTFDYTICEELNPGNCDSASVTVEVEAAEILADDDNFASTPVNGLNGGTVGSVFDGDTLNGAAVDPALVTVTIGDDDDDDGGLTGVSISPDGTLTVPPGTPSGSYDVTYQICENLNPDNCDTAVATIVVEDPQIAAENDDFTLFPISSFDGGTTRSVLDNDSYNNDPLAVDGAGEPVDVTLTPGTPPVTPASGSLTMNADGTITVAPGTTAGTYTFPYEICDDLNPDNCATAAATVVVEPPAIDAVAEPVAIVSSNPSAPVTALNVLGSDRINGVQATPANVTISPDSTLVYFVDGAEVDASTITGGVTVDEATGDVIVAAGSQGFRVEVTYEICDINNPDNCDTATETVLVPPITLEALPEAFPPVSGLTGGTLPATIIASDVTGDGVGDPVPVNLIENDVAEVEITQIGIINIDTGAATTAITLDTDTGEVTVAPNTPAGTYGVTYEICLVQSPTVCRQLQEEITVTAAPIDALPDEATGIDGNAGADDVLTVYDNDTLNGVTITEDQIDNGDITLAVLTPATPLGAGQPVPTLDPADGTVDVPAGTPAGTYEITYEICEALNTFDTPTPGSENCAVAVATVEVDLPPIIAIDDDFSGTPADGLTGGNIGSIFDPADDDTLDGNAISAADITSGAISLALDSAPTPINGGPVPQLDLATGAVSVPAGTPAGTYSFDYTICDTVNTFGAEENCATATVTVAVDTPEITADPDTVSDIDGIAGADDVLSVLDNDMFAGDTVTPADIANGDVSLAVLTPATSIGGGPVPVLDPTDGTVDVPAGTPQGTYVITYEICDTLNTFGTQTNCATTTATVQVLPDPPVAQNDLVEDLPTGAPAILNPFADNGSGPDTDGDGTLNPASVVFTGTNAPEDSDVSDDGKTLTVPDEGVWTVDDEGVVTFTPNDDFFGDPTPAAYTVEDNDANTSNEAIITLDYVQEAPVAEDDNVPGVPGEPTVVDVLGNDSDPNGDIDPATVTLLDPAATDSDGDGDADTLVVEGQGTWTVDPDSGAITFTAEPAFTGDPDPVQYTVDDSTGLTSNPATVAIDYPLTGTGISGVAYLDNDASGDFDPAVDELLPGVIVELRDEDGNLIASGTTDDTGFYELTDFAVGENFVLSFIDPETSEVLATIEGLDFAAGTVLADQDAIVVPAVPVGAIEIAKNALVRDVVVGGTAPFEIVLTNATAAQVGPVTVVDRLPVGLVYTPETAALDGTDVEPDVAGRTLTFTDVIVPPNGTATITLQTRVTSRAPAGDIVNRADVIDPATGIAIADTAEATIRRRPEAVFNCSDVIGKVFDDRNMDGYQNPLEPDGALGSQARITDFDAPLDGKFSPTITQTLRGEPGLPNVRVITPTGTIVTTDQYGRFSVPCAELPGAIGTNYALKVDTNSLPTGYRMTTENPLVLRLTAGSFAEMNFGAAIGRVVGIDLTAAAFQTGSTEPVARLEEGIASLLAQVVDTPSIIRLSYFTNGESNSTSNARLDAVEQMINDRWDDIGRYRLIIERTTKQMQ